MTGLMNKPNEEDVSAALEKLSSAVQMATLLTHEITAAMELLQKVQSPPPPPPNDDFSVLEEDLPVRDFVQEFKDFCEGLEQSVFYTPWTVVNGEPPAPFGAPASRVTRKATSSLANRIAEKYGFSRDDVSGMLLDDFCINYEAILRGVGDRLETKFGPNLRGETIQKLFRAARELLDESALELSPVDDMDILRVANLGAFTNDTLVQINPDEPEVSLGALFNDPDVLLRATTRLVLSGKIPAQKDASKDDVIPFLDYKTIVYALAIPGNSQIQIIA